MAACAAHDANKFATYRIPPRFIHNVSQRVYWLSLGPVFANEDNYSWMQDYNRGELPATNSVDQPRHSLSRNDTHLNGLRSADEIPMIIFVDLLLRKIPSFDSTC